MKTTEKPIRIIVNQIYGIEPDNMELTKSITVVKRPTKAEYKPCNEVQTFVITVLKKSERA
jgi:hypothetical protein